MRKDTLNIYDAFHVVAFLAIYLARVYAAHFKTTFKNPSVIYVNGKGVNHVVCQTENDALYALHDAMNASKDVEGDRWSGCLYGIRYDGTVVLDPGYEIRNVNDPLIAIASLDVDSNGNCLIAWDPKADAVRDAAIEYVNLRQKVNVLRAFARR